MMRVVASPLLSPSKSSMHAFETAPKRRNGGVRESMYAYEYECGHVEHLSPPPFKPSGKENEIGGRNAVALRPLPFH